MGFFFYLVYGLFMFVALILVLLVLIQKGRGGGLASAFGGGGGNTAFGSKTGDVLTWATSIVFGVFLVLGIALNLIAGHVNARETGQVQTTPAGPTGPTQGGNTSLPQPPAQTDPGVPPAQRGETAPSGPTAAQPAPAPAPAPAPSTAP